MDSTAGSQVGTPWDPLCLTEWQDGNVTEGAAKWGTWLAGGGLQ